MTTPKVTFIVPCYNLGHLVGECITSILSQTYRDLELIVMDDASTDRTASVVRAFDDDRIRYVRNHPNLGHLRNYNKGIGLARGEHLWIISADDRLERPYVLERFVDTLERNPNASYVFCPVNRFQGDRELFVYGAHGDRDTVFDGSEFLGRLAIGNSVPAASALARTRCYERQGPFPLDLPFAGDWYLWCAFALVGDVAYLAEPMVGWRLHANNMTHDFKARPAALVVDELAVRWRLKRMCEAVGYRRAMEAFFDALAWDYAERVVRKTAEDWRYGLTEPEFERSLGEFDASEEERAVVRARVYAAEGDHYVEAGNPQRATELYARALVCAPRSLRTRLKATLLRSGPPGMLARRAISGLRQARRARSLKRSAQSDRQAVSL